MLALLRISSLIRLLASPLGKFILGLASAGILFSSAWLYVEHVKKQARLDAEANIRATVLQETLKTKMQVEKALRDLASGERGSVRKLYELQLEINSQIAIIMGEVHKAPDAPTQPPEAVQEALKGYQRMLDTLKETSK